MSWIVELVFNVCLLMQTCRARPIIAKHALTIECEKNATSSSIYNGNYGLLRRNRAHFGLVTRSSSKFPSGSGPGLVS